MKVEINTLQELVSYVKTNYNTLTDSQYQRLLNTTLFIYPFEKPKTVQEAVNVILKFGNLPIETRPLFNIDEHEEI